MNKTVIKFGLYGFITAAILFLLALVLGDGLSFATQEVIGYSSMVVSLVFVYFGIKNYRDYENNGHIRFGKALGIGMLITLFAALGFAIIDFIYTSYINPEFVDQFISYQLEVAEKSLSGEELIAKKTEIESYKDMSSTAMALLMFVTVILIGFIISLISSFVLNKK
jgi:putative flippase GtrA